jgi:hypothetical protein
VGAGHGDAVLQAHQLGQHLGAGDGRHLSLPGRLDLDVAGGDGRGVHEHVDALHVLGLVSDDDLGAQPLQTLDRLVAPLVGAAHLVAEVEQDLRDAGHADAADADEVDVLVALKHARAGRC